MCKDDGITCFCCLNNEKPNTFTPKNIIIKSNNNKQKPAKISQFNCNVKTLSRTSLEMDPEKYKCWSFWIEKNGKNDWAAISLRVLF